MTYNEILNKMIEFCITKENFGDQDFSSEFISSVGDYNRVYKRGGQEQGSSYSTVIHFIDHDIYIRLNGYYSSYEGVDYDNYDYQQVVPKEKVITVYNPL